MRCIPEEPEFGEGQLAEKGVWDALRKSLPYNVVLAHSVHVRDGRNEYEIDLLVLWPAVGMAAIEVKGGQVTIADGQWYQSDRTHKRKIQSPVAQSQSSLHALKNWLENQLGSRLSSRCAYMVSLPYTDVPNDWVMAGCPRSLILDQTGNRSPAELVRRAIENEGGGASPLAPAFLERIVRHLSGNLDTAVGNSLKPQEDEDVQDHLTERQSVLLQATRSLPRIRFTGGAGSGKTWLAGCGEGPPAQQAGQASVPILLQQGPWAVSAGPRFHVAPGQARLHRRVPRICARAGGSGRISAGVFGMEMPRLLKKLAATMEPHERLDAVVVDEAQDFAPLWWDALLACTKDPTAVKCMPSWMTVRTSTAGGAARLRTSPTGPPQALYPSTLMRTSATPARLPKRSNPLLENISLPAAARACLSGSLIALPTTRSTSAETASTRSSPKAGPTTRLRS